MLLLQRISSTLSLQRSAEDGGTVAALYSSSSAGSRRPYGRADHPAGNCRPSPAGAHAGADLLGCQQSSAAVCPSLSDSLSSPSWPNPRASG
ncbi:unnamed protein product [Heligmosomoides polygyrus]|uniref:Secreted protein n=1 Tax=Heligmosomoides polygyrus TaxID=6339 RepID=A0A183FYM4_HELPZ|nr:unnamed protein product [Heligmosomoides polygyrus]